MTDKKKIIKELKDALDSLDYSSSMRLTLVRTIEYLYEETVSEEQEDAASKYAHNLVAHELYGYHITDAFKAGAQWQKKQMINNVTEAIVAIDAGGYPYIPQIELYDYDKDIPLAKEGDKYKVVLIKEGKNYE